MKRLINRASAVAALVALAGLVSTVEAAGKVVIVDSIPTREVFYGDLDLNTQEGLATLHGRIHQAAEQVCGISSLIRVRLDEAMAQKQCRDKAIAGAFTAVNQAKVLQASKKVMLSAVR